MKGTRALDNNEIRLALACFNGTFEARNRGLMYRLLFTARACKHLLAM